MVTKKKEGSVFNESGRIIQAGNQETESESLAEARIAAAAKEMVAKMTPQEIKRLQDDKSGGSDQSTELTEEAILKATEQPIANELSTADGGASQVLQALLARRMSYEDVDTKKIGPHDLTEALKHLSN